MLVARIAEADREAFRVLFERYQPLLFRLVLSQLHDRDEAHDVVQETFIRLWDHRVSLDPGRPVLAYALRITDNLIRDAARRRSVRERYQPDVPQPNLSEGDDPEQALQVLMLQEQIASIISEDLPERCRSVFILSRFEGKSAGEIAALLGLSVKTVENQIGHALKVLRKRLGRGRAR